VQGKNRWLVVRAEKEKLIAQTLATNSDQKAASVAEREDWIRDEVQDETPGQ